MSKHPTQEQLMVTGFFFSAQRKPHPNPWGPTQLYLTSLPLLPWASRGWREEKAKSDVLSRVFPENTAQSPGPVTPSHPNLINHPIPNPTKPWPQSVLKLRILQVGLEMHLPSWPLSPTLQLFLIVLTRGVTCTLANKESVENVRRADTYFSVEELEK